MYWLELAAKFYVIAGIAGVVGFVVMLAIYLYNNKDG